MVDRRVIAAKIAAIRDAVTRIREVLPATADAFASDRDAREIVTLNLFVALQESIALATHWLADKGWSVPQTHGETFTSLAEHGVIDHGLAARLRAAAGLRNLIAHQYGVIDVARVHDIAAKDVGDLLSFCRQLVERLQSAGDGAAGGPPEDE